MKNLPAVAKPEDELAWVGSHPMFLDLHECVKEGRLPELTAKDILYTQNGPAPSRQAVNRLVIYTRGLRAAQEFFRMIDSEAKKKVATEKKEQVDVEKAPDTPQILDLRKMLAARGTS